MYIVPLIIAISIALGFVYYENSKVKIEKPAVGNANISQNEPLNDIDKSQTELVPNGKRYEETSQGNPGSILESGPLKSDTNSASVETNNTNSYSNPAGSESVNYSNSPSMQSGSSSTTTPTKPTTLAPVINSTTNQAQTAPKTSVPPVSPEITTNNENLPSAPVSSPDTKPASPNLSAPSDAANWQPPAHDATNS